MLEREIPYQQVTISTCIPVFIRMSSIVTTGLTLQKSHLFWFRSQDPLFYNNRFKQVLSLFTTHIHSTKHLSWRLKMACFFYYVLGPPQQSLSLFSRWSACDVSLAFLGSWRPCQCHPSSVGFVFLAVLNHKFYRWGLSELVHHRLYEPKSHPTEVYWFKINSQHSLGTAHIIRDYKAFGIVLPRIEWRVSGHFK